MGGAELEGKGQKLSVIIPVLHEAEGINELIAHLRSLDNAGFLLEMVVVDGAEEADTLAALEDPGVVTLSSQPGRGKQLNAGAEQASGAVLLFLHADTRLPEGAFSFIKETVLVEGFGAGAFSLRVASKRISLKLISFFTTLRSRLTRTPYGDQGIFVRREVFKELAGFPDIPVMEDLEFMDMLRRGKHSVRISSLAATTSSRRWEEEGVWRRTLSNWYVRTRYLCGTPAEKLVKHYRPTEKKNGK